MYFERRLWRLVETFVPRLSDPEELVRMVAVGGKYVRRLEISELMPPVVRSVKEPTNADEDEQNGKSKLLLFRKLKSPTTLIAAHFCTYITCV